MKDKEIAKLVKEAGGTAYYVGGYVRDKIMGRKTSDIDMEIYGISEKELVEILGSIGEVYGKGKSFFTYRIKGYDIDIALPRKEIKTGKGHKGFAVEAQPFSSPEKAYKRRDFTVNALLEDVLTGEVLDYCNGISDIKNKVIRQVNENTFSEDPLRALRMCRFSAMLGFEVANETIELAKKAELSELAAERVQKETMKAIMKSEKPSIYFETLKEAELLDVWFPELKNIIGIEQDKRFHPEGDVWTHTMIVLDNAAQVREEAEYPEGFMMASLLHDLGKAETTYEDEDGKIRSIGHEKHLEPVKKFMSRLALPKKMMKYVENMVTYHMRPNQLVNQKSKQKAINRLYDESISPGDLILISKADYLGGKNRDYTEHEEYLMNGLEEYLRIMDEPEVTGKDLINEGIKPGKEMGELLDKAHRMKLSGLKKDEIIRQIIGDMKGQI